MRIYIQAGPEKIYTSENLYTGWSREDYSHVLQPPACKSANLQPKENASEYGGAVLQWGLRREICMLLLHQCQSQSPFLERSFWTSTLYCKLVSLSAAGIPMLDLIYVMFLYFHIQTANESQVSLHTSSLYSSKNGSDLLTHPVSKGLAWPD